MSMVGNVIPLMGNLCDQLTEQMSKVIDQVRHLPNYQINWSAVREVMRDLLQGVSEAAAHHRQVSAAGDQRRTPAHHPRPGGTHRQEDGSVPVDGRVK